MGSLWIGSVIALAAATTLVLLGSFAHRSDADRIEAREIERLRHIAPAAGPVSVR
ncbi:MAG: hypothetical protein AB7G39_01600 [Alphaproteobacteria bacterium]